jgi:hypothetical protein
MLNKIGLSSFLKISSSNIYQTCSKLFSSLGKIQNSPQLSNLKHISLQTPILKTNSILNSTLLKPVAKLEANQVRHNWGYKGRMMLKDIKRRELVRKYAPVRNRLQALRSNTILPKVLKV